MSIHQKVNQTKMVKKLFWINFPEGCLSLNDTFLDVFKKIGLKSYNSEHIFRILTVYK